MAALIAYPALAELTGKDFLSSADLSPEQTTQLLELAADLKAGRLSVDVGGRVLGLIFTKASTRTRAPCGRSFSRRATSVSAWRLRSSMENSGGLLGFTPIARITRRVQ